jgi:hypothetical protein
MECRIQSYNEPTKLWTSIRRISTESQIIKPKDWPDRSILHIQYLQYNEPDAVAGAKSKWYIGTDNVKRKSGNIITLCSHS